MKDSHEAAPLRLANGNLYVDAEVYEAFFGNRDSVAVLSRDHRIALFALSSRGSGGPLSKSENGRGDRVIVARELLRGLDLDDMTLDVEARWDAELGALVFPQPKPRDRFRDGAGKG